jgi:glycosyltransferase involved in cell wall biosynthesis
MSDNKGKPTISIYATVFNNGNVVQKSLDSILSQFPDFDRNFEFVIVDNMSTDGTYAILQRFAKEHRNIRVIRRKCSRGEGKRIAYGLTSGSYVFYLDLDNVYLKTLSKTVRALARHYRTGTAFDNIGFMDRRTMDRIGNWYDLNYAEDYELYARAISKGVRVMRLPVMLWYPELVKGKEKFTREKRYARGSLAFLVRRVRLFYDIARGLGMVKLSEVDLLRPKSRGDGVSAKLLLCVFVLFGRTRAYRYGKTMTNLEYVRANETAPDPRAYAIADRRFWLDKLEKGLPESITSRRFGELRKLGFSRFVSGRGNEIIAYTEHTDKKFVTAWKLN